MRAKALATFSATPSWGQSWRAISKVRAWRVSRLGEDLERLEAIVENLFLGARGRWPIASAFPSVRHKKARPGRTAPEGPERSGGRRRAANLPRAEFGFSRRGNSSNAAVVGRTGWA